MSERADWTAELRSYVGRRYGVVHAWDPVNEPMIRQWCEAVDFDFAPFLDRAAAAASHHGGIVAPATMLPVWLMPGLRNTRPAGSDPTNPREVMAVLERNGYIGILGTNCEQEYERPLKLGEKIACTHMVESISAEKHTRFGPGYFLTFLQMFSDAQDQPVGSMRLTILRFRPTTAEKKPPAPPQPALSQDTAFFWEGLQAGKLLIQRCKACRVLRHPPGPACTHCHSLEWDTVESRGHGTLFSFVVMHQPQVPGFDYPHPVGLIELDEGVRLVAPLTALTGLTASTASTQLASDPFAIGMRVEALIEPVAGEHRLPRFRPLSGA